VFINKVLQGCEFYILGYLQEHIIKVWQFKIVVFKIQRIWISFFHEKSGLVLAFTSVGVKVVICCDVAVMTTIHKMI